MLRQFFRPSSSAAAIKSQSLSALVTQLRRETGLTISQCRAAAMKSSANAIEYNDWYTQAIAQLKLDAAERGVQLVQKLASRATNEGIIGLGIESGKIVVVELNCETDFVARNEQFVKLTKESVMRALDCTNSTSLIDHQKVLPEWNLADAVGRIGERIGVRVALGLVPDPSLVVASYVHGVVSNGASSKISFGRAASVVMLKTSRAEDERIQLFGRQLSQHVVGFEPLAINTNEIVNQDLVLMNQPWLFDSAKSVSQIFEKYKQECSDSELAVVKFVRVAVGRPLIDAIL